MSMKLQFSDFLIKSKLFTIISITCIVLARVLCLGPAIELILTVMDLFSSAFSFH